MQGSYFRRGQVYGERTCCEILLQPNRAAVRGREYGLVLRPVRADHAHVFADEVARLAHGNQCITVLQNFRCAVPREIAPGTGTFRRMDDRLGDVDRRRIFGVGLDDLMPDA